MEFEYLQSIATEWHDQMLGAKLTHNDAVFSLHNVVMQKLIVYLLMVMTVSANQCNLIMRLILKQGLSKVRIMHTFPCTLAYAPLQYGGLEIPNLHTEQLVKQLEMLLRHGDKLMDMTSLLIWANVEAFKLEAGLQGELVDLPLAIVANITESWLKNCGFNAYPISRSCTLAIPKSCGCSYLMVKMDESKILNRCCMYLSAIWLSDICEGDGKSIQLGA